MTTEVKSELGTNVPSTGDALVRRFNELNQAIVAGIPEMARAYDILARHLPLLREMQSLLSQRPKSAAEADFTMLQRQMGKTIRIVMPVGDRDQLPSWTGWLTAYATAIDYSVRHLRRLVIGEERKKTSKKCGWSEADHNRLIRAATAAFDLVNAIEAGADTTALVEEIKEVMGKVRGDLFDKAYEPRRLPARKRGAKIVTFGE